MARLTHPNGTVVSVDDARVDQLLGRGFTTTDEKPKSAAPVKKAAKRPAAKPAGK